MTAPEDSRLTRDLTAAELDLVDRARTKTHTLYAGREVPHRSCGIALAETFGLPTAPYQALRKGGITGCGECGAIKAGELVLGEKLGDPDPTGPVTPELRLAATFYRETWLARVDRGTGGAGGSTVCNDLTSPFDEFLGPERHGFCTELAAGIAATVAETLVRFDALDEIEPVDRPGGDATAIDG